MPIAIDFMLLGRLFLEFCRVGLFSVGGGLATIPFLTDLGERMGWFSPTYVGFHTAGVAGGVIATLGLVSPSIVIILIIAGFLEKFRQSKAVDALFYGLRAASVALITAALLQVAKIALLRPAQGLESAFTYYPNWIAILLAAAIFILAKFTPLKKLHPICFIGLAALAGIVFQM